MDLKGLVKTLIQDGESRTFFRSQINSKVDGQQIFNDRTPLFNMPNRESLANLHNMILNGSGNEALIGILRPMIRDLVDFVQCMIAHNSSLKIIKESPDKGFILFDDNGYNLEYKSALSRESIQDLISFRTPEGIVFEVSSGDSLLDENLVLDAEGRAKQLDDPTSIKARLFEDPKTKADETYGVSFYEAMQNFTDPNQTVNNVRAFGTRNCEREAIAN